MAQIDKTEIGIPNELKLQKDCFEGICNPVLQAKVLNEAKTDLNVINGLCVGHDSLFIKRYECYCNKQLLKIELQDIIQPLRCIRVIFTINDYYRKKLISFFDEVASR